MQPKEFKEKRKLLAADFKKLRLEKGLSQTRLADVSGLRRGTIIRIETGWSAVLTDSLILYMDAIIHYNPPSK